MTLAEYGRLLGLAFQVFDDILDVSGDEAQTGKRLGTDIRDGTVTLPVIYALEERPELGPRLQRRPVDDESVDLILAEIVGAGAVDRARQTALGYILRSGDLLMALDADIDKEPARAGRRPGRRPLQLTRPTACVVAAADHPTARRLAARYTEGDPRGP